MITSRFPGNRIPVPFLYVYKLLSAHILSLHLSRYLTWAIQNIKR